MGSKKIGSRAKGVSAPKHTLDIHPLCACPHHRNDLWVNLLVYKKFVGSARLVGPLHGRHRFGGGSGLI